MSGFKSADIQFETERHFVLPAKCGFEVFRKEATHSVRCAIIGFKGDDGLQRAVSEIRRREALA